MTGAFTFLDWLWVGLFMLLLIGSGVLFYRLGKRSESDFSTSSLVGLRGEGIALTFAPIKVTGRPARRLPYRSLTSDKNSYPP